MIFKVLFLSSLLLSALSLSVEAMAANAPKSGEYDELMLARNPSTSMISGYFRSETGGGGFSCIFYFSGKLKSGAAEIESYFPETPNETIAGLITVNSAESVAVKLKEEHGGCSNVQHFADADQPAKFSMSKVHANWLEIRVVKSEQSNFFASPKGKKPLKAYLVKGNAVGVVENHPDWVKVDYPGTLKTTTGWIRRSDLY
ncbi:hypothetical protein BH10BDE1_BH10BDE1_05460 [soil metagenome]